MNGLLHRPELVCAHAGLVDALAAGVVARAIRRDPHLVLGVATGQTPEGLYRELVVERGLGLATEGITLVALDEYLGLEAGDPRSYEHYVHTRIAGPLGVASGNVHVPHGGAPDATAAAARYDALIGDLGGVDLQLVGIGSNGHIAFNEPGSAADSRTRVVELDSRTRADNARFFDDDPAAVPHSAMTQGIGTILEARRILLLARGARKAAALAEALNGPVTEQNPASLLRGHPNVLVIADEDAAALL